MEKEIKIDIIRCVRAVLGKWYIVGGIAVACAAVVFGLRYDTVQRYNAYTTIYSASYGSYSATTESMKAVQLYAEIVSSKKIAERAVNIMGNNNITPEEVQGMIYVNDSEDSPVLGVGAISTDPQLAVEVANAVAEAFVIEASNITAGEGIQILDKATQAQQLSNGVKRTSALAFIAGFMVSAIIIALLEIFSDRVYHVEDAELNGELEILGIIPDQSMKS